MGYRAWRLSELNTIIPREYLKRSFEGVADFMLNHATIRQQADYCKFNASMYPSERNSTGSIYCTAGRHEKPNHGSAI